jgi:hypothetical protein
MLGCASIEMVKAKNDTNPAKSMRKKKTLNRMFRRGFILATQLIFLCSKELYSIEVIAIFDVGMHLKLSTHALLRPNSSQVMKDLSESHQLM